MLLSGFEPESKPRKGLMIGRYTTGAYYNLRVTPESIRTSVTGSKTSMIDHYTTGLAIISSVISSGLELSYITLARKKLSLIKAVETFKDLQKIYTSGGLRSLQRGVL